ncbi:MAG: hypothetical protein JW702_08430 [Clostridiales bacterium]|nr:hypothetical protein [Clostridiales bacterium]
MKTAKILTLIATLVMGFLIPYGLITSSFTQEGALITSILWGKITLVDIYIFHFFFFQVG